MDASNIAHEMAHLPDLAVIDEVDAVNEAGYSAIADEFDSTHRLTTANFHALGDLFICAAIRSATDLAGNALEIGSGRGRLLGFISSWFKRLTAVDISSRMLELSPPLPNVEAIRASVFEMPIDSVSQDVVVSALADPFFRAEALREINRVLRHDGKFIFTLPSRAWASAIRHDLWTTEFQHSSGTKIKVYSFTWTDDELFKMLDEAGFQVEDFHVDYASSLLHGVVPLSSAISAAATSRNVQLNQLPVLQKVTARKVQHVMG